MKKRLHRGVVTCAAIVLLAFLSYSEFIGSSSIASTSEYFHFFDIAQIELNKTDAEGTTNPPDSDKKYTFTFPNIFDIFRSIF